MDWAHNAAKNVPMSDGRRSRAADAVGGVPAALSAGGAPWDSATRWRAASTYVRGEQASAALIQKYPDRRGTGSASGNKARHKHVRQRGPGGAAVWPPSHLWRVKDQARVLIDQVRQGRESLVSHLRTSSTGLCGPTAARHRAVQNSPMLFADQGASTQAIPRRRGGPCALQPPVFRRLTVPSPPVPATPQEGATRRQQRRLRPSPARRPPKGAEGAVRTASRRPRPVAGQSAAPRGAGRRRRASGG